MPFLTPLRAELVGERSGRSVWRLTHTLVYSGDSIQIAVPAGFETDFASVPRWPLVWWLAADTAHAPSVVHDYLYRMDGVSRKEADDIFYEAMAADQPELGIRAVPRWRRWLMWAAVRTMGSGVWAKYRKAKDTPQTR